MKNLLVAGMAVAALSSVAGANLVLNGDFNDGGANWNVANWGGTYFYQDGPDTICSQGWWNGVCIWQDTGAAIQANTLYTLTIRARNGDGTGRGVTINMQDTSNGWVDIIPDTTFLFPGEDKGRQGPWREFAIQLDSRTTPGLIGHKIGVSARVFDDTSWDPNGWGWVHYDKLDLEAQPVPEPVSMITLGIGALALAARRRRK